MDCFKRKQYQKYVLEQGYSEEQLQAVFKVPLGQVVKLRICAKGFLLTFQSNTSNESKWAKALDQYLLQALLCI
jgi:hypothetical protein